MASAKQLRLIGGTLWEDTTQQSQSDNCNYGDILNDLQIHFTVNVYG